MEFPTVIPFAVMLGFELLRYEGGEAEIGVDLRPDMLNAFGIAHGGLTMTLLDVTLAHAARSPGQPGLEPGTGAVTIEMKTSFLRPGEGRLIGRGRVLHRTAAMCFCEGQVLDAQARLVAHASGTFKLMRPTARGDNRRLARGVPGGGSD